MHKVNVSVPAVCTNVGPGYDVLGLALNLRNVIEMSLTTDERLSVQVKGEGKGELPDNFRNPVMTAATRLFQQMEQGPVGLAIACTNYIPLDVGLNARVALTVGGLVGANTLMGSPFRREDLIMVAADLIGQPEAVVTAMRGGLGIAATGPEGLFYRAMEIPPLRVVIALPELPDYAHRHRDDLPMVVPMGDAVHNIGHTALLIEALRATDYKLLKLALDDRLHEPYRSGDIPGYEPVCEAALEAGAIAVTLCGAGPAMMAFAQHGHQEIADAMQQAFEDAGLTARSWVLGIDTQGVVISVAQ
jgi:homoserine kinase